jgi:hypothetical protein
MRGEVGFLVAAYAIFWIALLVYVGWIALRLRGVRTDVEAVRELLDERERERERATEQPTKHE